MSDTEDLIRLSMAQLEDNEIVKAYKTLELASRVINREIKKCNEEKEGEK